MRGAVRFGLPWTELTYTMVLVCHSFEHSLVQELGYTGYERLRRAFDRAFDQKAPTFAKVLDAGCGTGLVGEQVSQVE